MDTQAVKHAIQHSGRYNRKGFESPTKRAKALGAAAYAIWTLVTCWIAWSVIGGLFGGIRVSEEEETQGLDIGEHGMEAYPDFASAK